MNWNEYFFDMCKFVSQKSKDLHTKAGCVIVGPDNEVRSTGFNGFPRGVVDSVLKFSGIFPADLEYTKTIVDARSQRPEKYVWTEHAERNAIYAAARMGTALKGCTIYVTGLPCFDCCRAIIQAGIVKVYIANYDIEYQRKNNDRYRFDATEQMFHESGVELLIRP
jgi:dCMP deaminase